MIIIVGYSLTEAADRDAAVAAFRPMVELARREGGCIDLHVSADPLDAERMCPSVFVLISSQGVKVLPTMSENRGDHTASTRQCHSGGLVGGRLGLAQVGQPTGCRYSAICVCSSSQAS
jgi:hypothetical protein